MLIVFFLAPLVGFTTLLFDFAQQFQRTFANVGNRKPSTDDDCFHSLLFSNEFSKANLWMQNCNSICFTNQFHLRELKIEIERNFIANIDKYDRTKNNEETGIEKKSAMDNN